MCDSDADVIGNDFAQLISNYSNDFATKVLADDYFDQSDSVNTLIDNATPGPIPVRNRGTLCTFNIPTDPSLL